MRLEHNFEVPVPVDRAWAVLLDVEQVAPCMPGAALTSFDGDAFAGNVRVKLGPVSLSYKGSGSFVERDEAAHRIVIAASGADSRGAGTAKATVTASLRAAGDNTQVAVVTELDVTGRAAQFGRGLISDVSGRLIGQFADCLAGKLAAAAEPAPAEREPSAGAPVEAAVAASVPAGAPAEAAPIDLLAVSGVSGFARRAAPYAIVAVLAFLVVLGLIWWLS